MNPDFINTHRILSIQSREAIDQWLQKFPTNQKQSGLIFALRTVQEENKGFLTTELMDAVADYLEIPKISVYEVASFYSLFNLNEVGCYQINVCTNISCMLRGSEQIVAHLKERLGIEMGQTTEDKRFTLKAVECLAACQGAPVMRLNKHYYEHLTPQKIDELLESL